MIRSSNKQEINSFRGTNASPLVSLPAGVFVLDWVRSGRVQTGAAGAEKRIRQTAGHHFLGGSAPELRKGDAGIRGVPDRGDAAGSAGRNSSRHEFCAGVHPDFPHDHGPGGTDRNPYASQTVGGKSKSG